jgi:hypothetical protein
VTVSASDCERPELCPSHLLICVSTVSELATMVGRDVSYRTRHADSLPFSTEVPGIGRGDDDRHVHRIHIEGDASRAGFAIDTGTALGRDDQWSWLVPVHPRLTPLAADGTIQALANHHKSAKVQPKAAKLLLAFRGWNHHSALLRGDSEVGDVPDEESEVNALIRLADKARATGHVLAPSARHPDVGSLLSSAAGGLTSSVLAATRAVGQAGLKATRAVGQAGHAVGQAVFHASAPQPRATAVAARTPAVAAPLNRQATVHVPVGAGVGLPVEAARHELPPSLSQAHLTEHGVLNPASPGLLAAPTHDVAPAQSRRTIRASLLEILPPHAGPSGASDAPKEASSDAAGQLRDESAVSGSSIAVTHDGVAAKAEEQYHRDGQSRLPPLEAHVSGGTTGHPKSVWE